MSKKHGYYVYPESINSATNDIEEILKTYFAIEKMAIRGFCEFPRIIAIASGEEISPEELYC